MNDIKIQRCQGSGTGLSAWEVKDKKDKLVGVFDARDKTRDRHDKLCAIATIMNLAHDLFDIRQRIEDLTHRYHSYYIEEFVNRYCEDNEWQIFDRALQACDQTKDAITELDLIIYHLKNEI